MSFRQAISVFLLLLAAIYSSEGVVTPVVNLTEPDGRDVPLVIGCDDYDINATFECTAPGTTTLWRVDDYLLVDRDQFSSQGLYVLDRQQGLSKLVFAAPNEDRKGGFPFVFEALERCYFTLYCLAMKDSVNVIIPDETNSSQTVASYHCNPQKPGISFVGCNGTSPIVRVTRPPNFNGLVELDYNFSTDGMPNGQIVPNKSDSSFTHTVGGCGEGCEICVKAISCEGEGEKACVPANCSVDPCVAKEPTIKTCQPKCEKDQCSIEYELEYQVPLCAKNYSFCDDNGCRDQLKSVEVAVPLTSLAYYTATFIVCTDDVCFTTTTPLGNATCPRILAERSEPDECELEILIIIIVAVGCFLLGCSLAILGAVIVKKCKDNQGKQTQVKGQGDKETRDSVELMNAPKSS